MRRIHPDCAARPATFADAHLLHKWRNDPVTRSFSFSSEPVDYETHVDWLQAKLRTPGCHIFIVTDILAQSDKSPIPIGMLRLEPYAESGHTLEIHYAVAPEHRGQGYGHDIISLADGAAPAGTEALIAYVLADNLASRRCFERSGYRCTEADGVYCFLKDLVTIQSHADLL